MVCDTNINPLLLIGFRGVERYSLVRVIRQFGWSERIPALNESTNNSFEANLVN